VTDSDATTLKARHSFLRRFVMNDVLNDIEVLENLVIAMNEGASDEKRMAVNAVERLIAEKKAVVEDFEKEFAGDTTEIAA